MVAIHYDVTSGLDTKTACGKSTHGWADISRAKPIQLTTAPDKVTCKSCLKVLGKPYF